MPLVLSGPGGKVTQGTADTALVFLTDWTLNQKQNYETQGPFLNDGGLLYRARTSKEAAWSFKGVVPSGKDASQTAINTALTAGADIKLILSSVGGYTATITLASVEEVNLGHDAAGTATFEASGFDNGGWTIAL
jgi:hypothetical protein